MCRTWRDAGEHRPRGSLGVERVTLAVVAPLAPVATVDLDDAEPLSAHEAREADPVGTCAFDPEGFEVAERARPGHQIGVARTVRWRPERREPGAQVIDRYRDMLVLVGVDADDHLDGRTVGRDAVRHVAGLLHGWRRRLVGRADRTVTGLQTGPYWVTAHPARQHLDVCCPTGSTDQTQDTKSVVGGVRTDQAAARSCSQSSERGIAWRVADSLSLRSFLDLELTAAAPDHSTLSRTRRRIDVETHEAVFTWVLERLSAAGLVRGKTVGIDATTLEANAAMRSIERRDTGESHEAFIRRLAEASGVETPTRADLARFDRSRKNKKTSNKEWKSPQDPDAKVAKMKDGRTHLAHKAEHGVDMDTGAIVAVTVQDASDGDTATLPETLIMAAEQVEAAQPAGAGVEEVVADKGYHSDKTLVALDTIGVRSHVSEPERGRRCWQDKKTGEKPPEKAAAQKALYGNRRRVRGRRGRRLQRCRGEVVERTFAHLYETGGMRRVWVRGHENVRKRVLLQAAACNIGLLLRRQTGVGTPRSLQGRAVSANYRLIGRLIDRWGRLRRLWGFKWTSTALAGSIAHRQVA